MIKDLKMGYNVLKTDIAQLKELNTAIGSDYSMLEKKLEYNGVTIKGLISKNIDLQDSLYQLQNKHDKRQK